MDAYHVPVGQQLARTLWETHQSGAAFDRKKTTHLTEQAQIFLPLEYSYGTIIIQKENAR